MIIPNDIPSFGVLIVKVEKTGLPEFICYRRSISLWSSDLHTQTFTELSWHAMGALSYTGKDLSHQDREVSIQDKTDLQPAFPQTMTTQVSCFLGLLVFIKHQPNDQHHSDKICVGNWYFQPIILKYFFHQSKIIQAILLNYDSSFKATYLQWC